MAHMTTTDTDTLLREIAVELIDQTKQSAEMARRAMDAGLVDMARRQLTMLAMEANHAATLLEGQADF